MHKIIHSKFEIDLASYKISTVENNHWFSDQFFTKYSFPFDIYLTGKLIKVFGDLLDDKNILVETFFEVKYVLYNTIENATFEITSQEGRILSTELRYGFDEFPNWNKKLSELPLEVTAINDIYAHAKTIIPQTWPAVNYNYPQIHTDKYDTTEDPWLLFNKIINNYDGTDFLVNTFSAENFANRNIIQPLPYLLHILTAGFLDAGYTLKGDITLDDTFKKICVFSDIDYFTRINEQRIDAVLYYWDGTTLSNGNRKFYIEVNLRPSKKYNLTGFLRFVQFFYGYPSTFAKITYKGTVLYIKNGDASSNYGTFEYDLDFEFETNSDDISTQLLQIEVQTANAYIWKPLEITIEEVSLYGTTPPDEINLKNEVNLKNVVPDMVFGTLITELKKFANIDLSIDGKDIYMNFISNEVNYKNAENLSLYEEFEPQKKASSNTSFLLKYRDIENENYIYTPVYQDKKGLEYSENNVNKDTNSIIIDPLPLPQKTILDIRTAFAFEQGGNSKMYFLLYDGLNVDGFNLTLDPENILIPNIHAVHYNSWFSFRIFARLYNWVFKMYEENLDKLKKKVFSYGRYHIIKSINKTQIDEDLYEVEIETETLP